MNDYGTVTGPDTVRLERLLPGPIERVWSYLIDAGKRGKWLASGPMELRIGGKVEHTFDNSHLSGAYEPAPEKYREYERATFTGRVTRCEPPRVLAYTWAESWGEDSEVTFELTPRGDEVHLVVTHRRLADRNSMVSVASGWHTHLDILAELLSGRSAPAFWQAHSRLEAEYERRIP